MNYGVLGAGMQGVAAAYDLGKFGDAKYVKLLDSDEKLAKSGADKINKLLKKQIVEAVKIDVNNEASLKKLLTPLTAVLSAVPYYLNPKIAKLAVETKTHFNDLGGDTPTVKQELALDKKAKAAGISIIPDCGVMPGMGNHFAAHAIEYLDTCEEVQVRCGGLPQHPKPPLGYKLVFSLEGLLNNYFGKAWILRGGKVTEVNTFDEYEKIDFPKPVGKCEAFTTTGATSTCPWTYEGRVKTWEYKTVRYVGHYDKIKALKDLGMIDIKPVKVKGREIVPRDLACTVIEPKIKFPNDPDLIVLRTTCIGTKNGKKVKMEYNVLDFEDEKSGFSAMSRCTAFSAAIVTIMMANGETTKGAVPLEKSVKQEKYIKELKKRGIEINIDEKTI